MKRKRITIYILFLALVLSLITSGCLFRKCSEPSKDIPGNVALDKFILGTWLSESAIFDDDGKEIGYIYEIEFIEKSTVKIKYYEPDGSFVDGDTLPYRFIDDKIIFIDTPRLQGGMSWLIERNLQDLTIHWEDGVNSVTFILKRGSFRCDYIVPTK